MPKKAQEESTEISFSRKIYSPRAVKAAAGNYSEFADFSIKEEKARTKVVISGIPAGSRDELVGEFCNYALILTKEE